MSKIKSFEELSKIRDTYKAKQELRDTDDNKTRITIGMATCGIAAGARKTYNAMIDEIKKQGVKDVTVTFSGCMGVCYAEPVVEVNSLGKPSILYGNVDEVTGRDIILKHILKGEYLQNHIIEKP